MPRYTKRANFSLGEQHIQWLKRIAQHTQRSQVQELRLAIEARGKALGIPPPPEPLPDPPEGAMMVGNDGHRYVYRNGEWAIYPHEPGTDMRGKIIGIEDNDE